MEGEVGVSAEAAATGKQQSSPEKEPPQHQLDT